MHTLVNRTARELARDYFNGQLSFDDYRDKRRRLIDQVTGVDADTGPSVKLPPAVEIKTAADEVPVHAAAQEIPSETRRFLLPVILLLMIGGLGVAGWLLFVGKDGVPSVPPVSMTQAPAPVVPESEESDRAGQLVRKFVAADDWTTNALAGFVLTWSVLEAADQDRARSTSTFHSLVEGLREQILEQRALGDITGIDERETMLISFAEHLGVSQRLADLQQVAIDTGDDSEPEPVGTESVSLSVSTVEVVAQPKAAVEKVPTPEAVSPVKVPVPVDDPCPASLLATRRPVCRDTLPDGAPGPILVVLPPGSFQMGSLREVNEQPVHYEEIGRPFAMSAYEVSRADYQRFCHASGTNCLAGHWSGDGDPMTNVDWNDARAYAEWLSQATGAVYRLPTEAEWEYAARAGTTTDFPFSEGNRILPSDARFEADSPLPVNDRSVNTNPFRLRHIMGNVREWVTDVWLEDYHGAPGDGSARMQSDNGKRVVRGGSYADAAEGLRAAARTGLPADTRDRKTGFRLVREIRN